MELHIALRRVSQCAEPIRLEPPPQKKPIENQSLLFTVLPSLTMSLPMLLGFYLMHRAAGNSGTYGSYMRMGIVTSVGSAILGAVWAFANLKRRENKARTGERLRKRTYRRYLNHMRHLASEQINLQENLCRNSEPDFSELINMERHSVRCFMAEPEDGIYLRLGMGELPYSITFTGSTGSRTTGIPGKSAAEIAGITGISPNDIGNPGGDLLWQEATKLMADLSRLKNVPVGITLQKGDTVRMIGNGIVNLAEGLIGIIIRLCLTYHPHSLKIIFELTDPYLRKITSWSHFLPHTVPPDEVEELLRGADSSQEFIVLISDSKVNRNLNRNPGRSSGQTSNRNPNQTSNIITISLATRGDPVLHDQHTILLSSSASGKQALLITNGVRRYYLQDTIRFQEAELAARCLTGLRNHDGDGSIPNFLPITKLLCCNRPPNYLSWMNTDVITSLSVPIGMGEQGKVICLDTHEKQDGPHGLIAGMTGSGKSELLMTFILSLALKYPPWEVAFFLIDYKGGGMSSAFQSLPHVIGSISNLSGDLIDRAFLSIRSENERRQRLFLAAGVNNISDYHRGFRKGYPGCMEPLPHIYLIVDEFAQLKKDQPDFMQELLSLSRIGRSLGIHLILCTQKPTGSVDNSIMTNSRFRIALRLQDPMDSKELLRRSDAADLKNPGRAILQVGNDETFLHFQSAYTGAPVTENHQVAYLVDGYGRRLRDSDVNAYGRCLRESDVNAYGRCLTESPARDSFNFPPADRTSQTISEECSPGKPSENGLSYLLRCINLMHASFPVSENHRVRQLWLNPLPEVIEAQDLMGMVIRSEAKPGIPIGIYDDPKRVKQGPYFLDINAGHIFICGMPRSGKSTLLHTYLSGYPSGLCPMKVVIIDFGGGMLREFEEADFAERYFGVDDLRTAEDFLAGLVGGTGTILRAEGKADGGEVGRKAEKGLLLVIDGLDHLMSMAGYGLQSVISDLLKNATGEIRLMLTANEISQAGMNRAWHGYMAVSVCLRQKDLYQYGELLSAMPPRSETLKPGEAYVMLEEQVVKMQVAKM